MPRKKSPKEYMDDVYDTCWKLKGVEEEQKRLKEETDQLKKQLKDALIGVIRGFPTDKLLEEASDLYWSCREYCQITKQAYQEVTNKRLIPIPDKYYPDCLGCEDRFEMQFKSWDEQKRWQRRYDQAAVNRNDDKFSGRTKDCYCENCIEESEQKFKRHCEERDRKEQEELRFLKTMPYPEYLQTQHWKTTRLRALRRAEFSCQLCNRTKHLQVHHRTYERRGCEVPADLIVLCRSCHEKHHDIISEWSEE